MPTHTLLSNTVDRKKKKPIDSRQVSKKLERIKPPAAVLEIAKLSQGQSIKVMGNIIFPGLMKKLIEDDAFFIELSNLLSKRSRASRGRPMTQQFRLLALDALNSAAHKKNIRGELLKKYQKSLMKIATNKRNVPLFARARAIRMLVNYQNNNSIKTLQRVAKSKKIILVDAIGHVYSKWYGKYNNPPIKELDRLGDSIITFANQNPEIAKNSQGIINSLALSKEEFAKKAFLKILEKANNEADFNRIFNALRQEKDESIIVPCIQKGIQSVKGKSPRLDLLRNSLEQKPEILGGLLKKKHLKEYLAAILFIDNTYNEEVINELVNLCKNTKSDAAKFTRFTIRSLSNRQRKRILEKGISIPPPLSTDVQFENKSHSFFFQKTLGEKSFEVISHDIQLVEEGKRFFKKPIESIHFDPVQIDPGVLRYGIIHSGRAFIDKGNAVYKNLSEPIQDWFGVDDHWHAGLYLGFFPDFSYFYTPYAGNIRFYNGRARMQGIHMNDLLYGIEFFGKSFDFNDASASLANEMEQLYTDFIGVFEDGDGFQGHRTVPNVSGEKRKAICDTALSTIGEVPWYTFADMLDYWRPGWDGSPEEIISMRCDGLVEYSYEKNGIKVCSGEDPSKWNIAYPDGDYVDNHNDFHTYSYDEGEICPRIQSGSGHGNTFPEQASTFQPIAAEFPKIKEFNATPDICGLIPPIIQWNVESALSEKVYVRITVRKDGGPSYFLMADDRVFDDGTLYWETPIGPMKFMKMNKSDYVFWHGRTVNGPDFWGQEGTFEFRCVVIDEAGNVSPTIFRKVEFKVGNTSGWSRPNPWNRHSEHIEAANWE
jgi:hypothetical protein